MRYFLMIASVSMLASGVTAAELAFVGKIDKSVQALQAKHGSCDHYEKANTSPCLESARAWCVDTNLTETSRTFVILQNRDGDTGDITYGCFVVR